MRDAVRGGLFGLVVLSIADASASRLGWTAGLWPRAEGPWAWVASRAFGIVAYLTLTADAVFGLFVSTGLADRWVARVRSMEVHRWLSGVALSLTAAHALVLLLDSTVRFDALDVLVPFAASYRPLAVALGSLALYAMYVVRESFAWRPRIGVRAWSRLHALAFVAFAMATGHGLFAGSDSVRPWMRAIYLIAVVLVVVLSVHRFRRGSRRGHAGGAARAHE